MNDRLIFVIDLDAFFASCEELRHPQYKDIPMAVGNEINGRGIVTTSNYAARSYGIKSGMPLFKARELYKDLTVMPVDYVYYQGKANEVFNIIKSYSDLIEFASIDECYVDLTELGNKRKPIQIARDIALKVKKETGLSVSIGISTNILLAKMASNLDKPNGISTLYKHEIETKLWPMPVGELYMVGNKSSEKLIDLDIKTIKDLALIKEDKVRYDKARELMGINLDKAINSANGIYTDKINYELEVLKSISRQKTYGESLTDIDNIRQEIRILFEYAILRAKRRKLLPTTIAITMKVDKSFSWKSSSVKLEVPTLEYTKLWSTSDHLLDKIFKSGMSVKSLGIALEGLREQEKTFRQSNLNELDSLQSGQLQDIAEKASLDLGMDIVKASTMEDNRKYEQTDPVDMDSVKFKVWEK